MHVVSARVKCGEQKGEEREFKVLVTMIWSNDCPQGARE